MLHLQVRPPARFIAHLWLVIVTVLAIGLPLLADAWGNRLATAQGIEPDDCAGDERISFAPAEPTVGESLLVAVTSSRQHRGVWLAGAESIAPQREYEGQLGWVWNWVITPELVGPHRFQFFVDSTTFCAAAAVEVGLSSRTVEQTERRPLDPNVGDDPVEPARLAGDAEQRGPNAGGKPKGPQIASLSHAATCAERVLMIRGQGFGEPRLDVDGKIVLGGAQVQHYLRWAPTEVIVLVPDGARLGPQRALYLINHSGYAETSIDVFTAPC